ncbi:organomercurial lyase [Halegenticoccus soli]|uniref:organomercurial lyase n=1 Tax=Halegenticoccus soli TaxID=1985678 RepID=UPI000C6C8CB4|nr:organomercurial lyase [Halegenticoccus soli]
MTDEPCPCCGNVDELASEIETSAGQWIREESVLDTELPRGMRVALGRFLGSDSIETLGEWACEVRQHVGGSISVEELCLSSEQTEHWGIVDGDQYYFACFYDAVILAALSDQPVDIHTVSPAGDTIEAHAIGSSELTVAPEEAIFSFGIEKTVEPSSDDSPTLEQGYASICPYVKAFPNFAAYERWAKRVPATTVAMPLAGATELAAELVRRAPE